MPDPASPQAPPRWAHIRTWTLGGTVAGALCGLVILAVSLFGGDNAWAGMTLLSAVLSFPAGLWVFQLAEVNGYFGLEIIVLAPTVNGALLGTTFGVVISVLYRLGNRR